MYILTSQQPVYYMLAPQDSRNRMMSPDLVAVLLFHRPCYTVVQAVRVYPVGLSVPLDLTADT